jgi:maltose O-acetyltransferase
MISFIKKFYSHIIKKKRKIYIENLQNKGLILGEHVNIIDNFFFDPSHCFLISIGDDCTICPNVRLIAHDASTKQFLGYTKIGRINIGNNCFLGDSVIVLPGVKIGANSIIGSGAVVCQDIPPDSVAAGNPAKVIFSLQDYLKKVKIKSEKVKKFGKDYWIEHLDEKKRLEILREIGSSIGFIE